MDNFGYSEKRLVRVGIIGTGYAAKLRAETFQKHEQAQVIAIVGHTPEKTQEFAQTYQTEALPSWDELVAQPDIDLVVISNINKEHGAIATAALQNNKHVIVEYPLALDVNEAENLITLAQKQGKMLHVEHIELLGGLHQALKQNLPAIGNVFYARYATVTPQRPAPHKWTYHKELFGFPLIAALSRLHRLTDLFGEVASVSCQNRYWGEGEFYQSCLCTAQLKFTRGAIAEVTYGKGETLWQDERKFEVHGEKGGLIFEGDAGKLIQAAETTPIEIGSRRGLFAKDTEMVLDHLFTGADIYITPTASLYTLKVADAARRSAEIGETIFMN
ncbi:Gfo/Idh/MocA family protein [Gloeocapsopsis dulcis]|uniref:Glycosyl transferase family 2 n=1 Tax=Gloeocapsopsis dulcis AAB1 = 1H9 TaxID=1433147 RepID=A0A6N8FXY6_9CHRO|nr:Gfo/Idh/MocA family oxidoreductase [Gloeocapsopsis dulcis]MUL37998.1 glycosyl transferase family 2 [Gloeocapsopsis dulcis AAB1 = 1H9]WNN91522.1 Gfo/Idh/MocA family oxidoreductase [Gloeocapsopsis dulcis]